MNKVMASRKKKLVLKPSAILRSDYNSPDGLPSFPWEASSVFSPHGRRKTLLTRNCKSGPTFVKDWIFPHKTGIISKQKSCDPERTTGAGSISVFPFVLCITLFTEPLQTDFVYSLPIWPSEVLTRCLTHYRILVGVLTVYIKCLCCYTPV